MSLPALFRRPVFSIWLLFICSALVYLLLHVRLVTDMSQFLPEADSELHDILIGQIKEGAASRLLLIGIEGGETAELAKASVFMQQQLKQSDLFLSVRNGSQGLNTDDYALLFKYRYLLMKQSPQEHFSVSNMRNALQQQLRIISSSMIVPGQLSIERDPTMAALGVIKGLEPIRKPSLVNGVWFSADKSLALLVAQTRASAFDLNPQQVALEAVSASLSSGQDFSHLKLKLSGPAVFALNARDIISTEAVQISLISTVLVLVFLLLVFRNVTLVLFGAVPLLTAIVTAVLVLQLLFGAVHGITLAFGVTLIGVAIDYPIHLFSHKQQQETASLALMRLWPTLRLGLLTTVMGYIAMLFSGFTGLVQLGFFAVCGLATAVLVTRWVLPLVVPDDWFLDSAMALPGLGLSGNVSVSKTLWLVAGMALLALFFTKNPWQQDIAALNPVLDEQKQIDRDLRKQLGAPDTRHLILVKASNEQAVLRKTEKLAATLAPLLQNSTIEGFTAITDLLPSEDQQKKQISQFPPMAELRRRFNEAAQGLPFKKSAFDGFFNDVSASIKLKPLNLSDLEKTELWLKVQSLTALHHNNWYSLVPLSGIAQYQVLDSTLEQQFPDGTVQLLDLKKQSSQIMGAYRDRALYLFALGCVGILLVLFLGLRSFRRGLAVFLPVAAALAVTCVLLLWAGEKFNLFHLASLLLVVGIGLDFSLFFQRFAGTAEDREKTYRSLMVCSVTTIVVFGVLAFAATPVLHAIGVTVATGTVFCLIYAVFSSGNGNPRENIV